jgi:hypothetical protein
MVFIGVAYDFKHILILNFVKNNCCFCKNYIFA